MNKLETIKTYFNSWINNDISIINKNFSTDISYTECYGAKYKSKESLLKWFKDWQMKGNVISWDIKNIYECQETIIVEWNFKCEWDNNISDFDGVSIVEFDENNLIVNLREFESKSKHYFPYE